MKNVKSALLIAALVALARAQEHTISIEENVPALCCGTFDQAKPDYTDTGYIKSAVCNENGEEGYAWQIRSDEPVDANLLFRYSLDGNTPTAAVATINGLSAVQFDFEGTGVPSVWTDKAVNVTLVPGSNVLMVSGTGVLPLIDHVSITVVGTRIEGERCGLRAPVLQELSEGTCIDSSIVVQTARDNYTGTGYIDIVAGQVFRYSVEAYAMEKSPVLLRYTNDGLPVSLQVFVNGYQYGLVTLRQTRPASWEIYNFELQLSRGENEIKFMPNAGGGPASLDYFMVYGAEAARGRGCDMPATVYQEGDPGTCKPGPIETLVAGYSGPGYLTSNGEMLTWQVRAFSFVKAAATIRYSNPDGFTVTGSAFPVKGTGDWSWETYEFEVSLIPGGNMIRLPANDMGAIDYLMIANAKTGGDCDYEMKMLQEENPSLCTAGTVMTTTANFTGPGYTAYADASFTVSLIVTAPGTIELAIRYIHPTAMRWNVEVDGVTIPMTILPASPADQWSVALAEGLPVTTGSKLFVLSGEEANGGAATGGVDVDYVMLYPQTAEIRELDCGNSAFIIQEDEKGFCDAHGVVDVDHEGYTGTGFTNVHNQLNHNITWNIVVYEASRAVLHFRYAHGGGSSRRANFYVASHGVEEMHLDLDMLPTGSWSTWEIQQGAQIELAAGPNTLILSSDTNDGLANIDYVMLVTDAVLVADDCEAPTIIIQEDEAGFCGVDGETVHGSVGTGAGYTNLDNTINSGIYYSVFAYAETTANVSFHYANGDTSANPNREGELAVGDEVYSFIMTPTGSWTTWRMVTINNVRLPPGVNRVTALSKSAAGLGHVDYLMFQVDSLVRADDCLNPSLVIQEEEEGYCGSDGVIEVEHNGHSGTGYTNTHNNAGHNITWNARAYASTNATLTIRYANGGDTDRHGLIIVNGEIVSLATMSPTGGWTTWGLDVVPNVPLTLGSNKVVMTSIMDAGLANVDYLMIASPVRVSRDNCAGPSIVVQEEETGYCSSDGSIEIELDGTGFVAGSHGITWSVLAYSQTKANLTIRFRNAGQDRLANVNINYVFHSAIRTPPTTGWEFVVVSDVIFQAGPNQIELSPAVNAEGLANVDFLMVSPEAPVLADSCAEPTVVIQEEELGICAYDGILETNLDTRYVNAHNTRGAAVTWSVRAYDTTWATITFRYASGSLVDRHATLSVNGIHHSNVTMSPTGDWSVWGLDTVRWVRLQPGPNAITLTALVEDEGLANIDYIMVTGSGLVEADSCTTPSVLVQELEPGYCGSDGVIEWEHKGHTGAGFINGHNGLGHNITWNLRAYSETPSIAVIRYANGGSTDRAAFLYVGSPPTIHTVIMPPTGSWTTWKLDHIPNLILQPGNNPIVLTSRTGDGVGNIDYLMVTPLPIPNNGVLEVDSCTGPTLVIQEDADGFCFTDGVTEYEHGSHTAGGYINTHNGQGHNITWSVRAFANVNATVIVRYASGDTNNREGTFYVNGVEYPTISMPGTGDWHVWAYDIVPGFMLYPGTNKITLMSLTNTGLANVDYLMVLGNGELLEADYCKVPTLVLQEDATGYCDQHGTVDNNHDGHTGTGFSNTDNEFGNNITWSVRAYSRTTANAIIRYANGGTQERHGHMYVNGEQYPLITFPLTGAWTNWGLDRLGNITLQPGPNEIVLSANQNDGLANIDYLMLEGDDILEADSCTQPSLIVQELTEGYCKSDGVVSVEHDDHSGPGYVDTHNNKGHGITWNVRAYQVVTATVIVRFANGATDNRDASLMVNGVETGTMLMPSTGSWFTWQLDVAQNVQLIPGANLLQLVATTDAGLGNVDYIMVIGDGLLEADPCDSPTLVIQERVSGYCGSDGIIEEEHTDHGDGAYTNTHNYEGTNITWNVRTYVPSNVTIVVRYANGGDKDRHGMLSVNGEGVAVTTMPMTGDWKAWALDVIENVPLEAGANLLKLTAMIDHGLANVDYLMVKSSELVVVDECDMPSVILQEYETGYCHSDGIVEDEHDGHTGAGFTNTFNELNHNITWNVRAYSEIMTNFSVRFANGGNNDRHAIFYVNGDAHPNILMARTYAWTNWSMDFIYDVKLYPGANSIVLSSGQEEGLANVDYLMITGSGPVVADSCLSPTIVIQEGEDEPGYCSADGVIEWDHGEHSGGGYTNGENNAGLSIVYQVLSFNPTKATVAVRFANGGTEDRHALLSVNGREYPNITMSPTGSWTTWALDIIEDVELDAGSNTVVLTSMLSLGLGNVDYLMVTSDGLIAADSCDEPSVIIQENEVGYCGSDGVVELEHDGHTGTGFINTHNNEGNNVTWNVRSYSTMNTTISFRYANGGTTDRHASLSINGKEHPPITMPMTGSWTRWEVDMVENVELNPGANRVVLTSIMEHGLGNIDYMMIRGPGLMVAENCMQPALAIQESEAGFRASDGNTVYEGGVGYVDTHTTGGSNISYSVRSFSNVNATFLVRFANGETTPLNGKFSVDGVEYPTLVMPGTGDWSTWDYASTEGIMMEPGTHTVVLTSLTNEGLANIDYLMVLGDGLVEADSSPHPSVVIQEDEIGYCEAHGTVDENHDGHTGTGFTNTHNEFGNNVTWSVRAYSKMQTDVIIRYANGGSKDRHAYLVVNGVQSPLVTFATTGQWAAWDLDRIHNITLQPGPNSIILSAFQTEGLANIDYLMLANSDDIVEADSCDAPSVVVQEFETGYCGSDNGVVEWENGDQSGTGYTNTHNADGHSITWSVRSYEVTTATIAIRYANGGAIERKAVLSVNGVPYDLLMMPTATWTTWELDVVSGVRLMPGNNSVVLTSVTEHGLANIDYMMVSNSSLVFADECDAPALVIQEEAYGFCGTDGKLEWDHGHHSGTGYINSHEGRGSNITWAVEAAAAGNVQVVVRYANGDTKDRLAVLQANGIPTLLSMPQTGSWTTWKLGFVEAVPLQKGVNAFMMTSVVDHGLGNIDYMMVVSSTLPVQPVAGDCDNLPDVSGPSPWVNPGPWPSPVADGAPFDDELRGAADIENDADSFRDGRAITAGVSAWLVSMAASPLAASRLPLLAGACMHDNELSFVMSPTQMDLGDEHGLYTGCVNGNMAVVLAVTVLHAIFAFVSMKTKSLQNVLGGGENVDGVLSVFGLVAVPAWSLLFFILLYQGFASCGSVLLFYPNNASECILGLISVLATLAFPAYVLWTVRNIVSSTGDAVFVNDTNNEEDGAVGGLKIAFLGHGEWIPLHHVPVDRFGYLFMAYLPRAWFFLAVECVLAVTLAIIDAIKAHTWTGCGNKKIVMLCAMVIYLGVVIWKMPHKQTFANALEILVTVLLCFSLLFMAIAYYSEDNVEHWCYSAANTIFTIATFVLLAKCILLMASALGVILTKRRSRLSDRVDASRNSYKLGDNYYNRELSTSLLNLDDGSSDADAGEELEVKSSADDTPTSENKDSKGSKESKEGAKDDKPAEDKPAEEVAARKPMKRTVV
ncbi:Alpha-L-arabinofuranosidase C [Diplonema papillatum]|nr:Alpha-L-arabinofuranosidase C [Diplonema papillatum]